MKKYIVFIIMFTLFTIPFTSASAHPGRTASDGKHYCRTNCDDWGVPWFERHGHSGGSSKSSSSSSNTSSSSYSVTVTAKPIVEYKIITALKATPVYRQPNTTPENILRTLPYGTIIGDRGGVAGWKTIKQADGTTVYISNHHTALYTPYDGWESFVVQPEKGYIFPTPSAKSRAKGALEQGTLVQVVGSYKDWYYIEAYDKNYKEVNGFMSKTVIGSTY